jgi:hypothetical protein
MLGRDKKSTLYPWHSAIEILVKLSLVLIEQQLEQSEVFSCILLQKMQQYRNGNFKDLYSRFIIAW